MSKNTKNNTRDFNALKELGFEFYAPQDEYSYQPDSGSTANGELGKQEYGIDVDLDARPYENYQSKEGNNIEDSSLPIPGESEFSQMNRLPLDTLDKELDSSNASDDALFELIQDSLDNNPSLHQLSVAVEVEKGVVTITGMVSNNVTRVLVNDIVCGLPGVHTLCNELSIISV